MEHDSIATFYTTNSSAVFSLVLLFRQKTSSPKEVVGIHRYSPACFQSYISGGYKNHKRRNCFARYVIGLCPEGLECEEWTNTYCWGNAAFTTAKLGPTQANNDFLELMDEIESSGEGEATKSPTTPFKKVCEITFLSTLRQRSEKLSFLLLPPPN